MGHAEAAGDLRIGQAFQLRQQESRAHLVRQSVEQGIDLHQGLQQRVAHLGARHLGFGQAGQCLQIGTFQLLAPVVVDQQAAGDGRQVGARLANDGQFAAGEYPQKGVVGQVSGIAGAAQATLQQLPQPGVMLAVEAMHVAGLIGVGERHAAPPCKEARFI
ncbi:hypothetical protein FQZ97_992990 [compost metagenome]